MLKMVNDRMLGRSKTALTHSLARAGYVVVRRAPDYDQGRRHFATVFGLTGSELRCVS